MGINLRQHGPKNWEYRIRYQDPISHKRCEKSKRGFQTKAEARYAAQEMEHKLLNNFELASQDIRLQEYMWEWLKEYKEGVVRKNTYEVHKHNIKKHINPYFKKVSLKELKPTQYQKFLNHLHDQGYSKRTIEIVHGTMRNALEKAWHLNMLERNPTIGATIKGKIKKQDIKFIDSSEISHFLSTAYKYGYIYWLFFGFMIETGMRKGEAAALQWSDIDFKKNKVHINKTLDFQANSNDELFGDTKTYKSERTISLSRSIIEKLRFHLQVQNQHKTNLNDFYLHDLNLVFCRDDGSILPKSTLFNAFSRILKQANIAPLPIHSLRHTHAVLLMESGADMKYIQERLGHGSYQITADVYSHISKRLDQSAMDKYESYMDNLIK